MTGIARRIREGDLRALARAATGVENRDPEALAALHDLAPFAGHARIVGITGPPGAGKSTVVDALARALRERGLTVAVLAVDPSSRLTGGAILGDRIRMSRHFADPGIFIRSMATRGSVGGLAAATRDLALLMDAAGRDYVLIETVGVGQDEIEIASLAAVNVVVQAPGMGDDVQAIKAGILEIADIFVINKADQPGAARMEQDLQSALSLADGPHPPIVQTVATQGKGIAQLLDLLAAAPAPQAPGTAGIPPAGPQPSPLTSAGIPSDAPPITREPLASQPSTSAVLGGQPATSPPSSPAAALAGAIGAPTPQATASTANPTASQSSPPAVGVASDAPRFTEPPSEPQSPLPSSSLGGAPDASGPQAPAATTHPAALGVEPDVPALPNWPQTLHHAVAFYAAPGLRPTPVRVPDLTAAAGQLSDSGGRLLNQPPSGGPAHLYVFVEPSPERTLLLELIQESAP